MPAVLAVGAGVSFCPFIGHCSLAANIGKKILVGWLVVLGLTAL